MAIKTFNVNQETYERFSSFCKEHGISMSKQIDLFMKSQLEEDPNARKDYIKKLNRIRKGKFIQVKSFAQEYNL